MTSFRSSLASARARLVPIRAALVVFLGPVVGRVNGAALPAELVKAARAWLAVGTLAGGGSAALLILAADAPLVFTSPLVAAIVAAILTRVASRAGQASPPAMMTPSPAISRFDDLPAAEAYREGLLSRAADPPNPVVAAFLASPPTTR